MISKSTIIEQALIRLGEIGTIYNDNRSEQYIIADKLLNQIIDSLAVDSNFLFNATTVELSKSVNEKNGLGEYRYNMPNDLLNVIKLPKNARFEGEFIYSTDNNVRITYCRKISIKEIPDYMKNLLIYNLASLLTDAYSAYESKKELMLSYYNREIIRVLNIEGFSKIPINEV